MISALLAFVKLEGDTLAGSRTLHDAVYHRPSKLLTVPVTVKAHELEALVDPGSQLNLISAMKAKELGLSVEPLSELLAKAANGTRITVYGTTVVDLDVRDTRGRVQTHHQAFIVVDMEQYPVYLGMPWIEAYNPKLNFATKQMRHRGTPDSSRGQYRKVASETAEEFDRTVRSPLVDVYAVIVHNPAHLGAVLGNLGQWPGRYAEFADVGSTDSAAELPDHGHHDLSIDLEPGAAPPHQPLYNLSVTELDLLRKYIEEYLARGWIRRSKSPAGAPILFAKKKDGSMRLCVDYRGLNKITVKNRGPLPLIQESLERLSQAKWFTKLDLKEAYHRVRIKEGDEWKTAFRTRYGHFEYTVMPFGLTNAPATFQSHINYVLAGLVDVTCIVYLDDILIFSDTEEDHEKHVKEVLQRLREAKLFCNPKKCEWHTRATEYLGYLITPEGVSIDPDRIRTIREWPMPRTVRDIRVFIGFMNYYRRFIEGFSRKALPLTKLTQKAPNAARGGPAMRREESQSLDIGIEGRKAWQELRDSFMTVPILAHFERGRKTRAEVDASGGAIAGILSQLVPRDDGVVQWRPIDFYSRKLIAAEYNYDTHDQELLAIVKSLTHWRHYLEGQSFEVLTDHHNLKWFMDTKALNNRQVRSYLALSKFDFAISHRSGVTNPADGPSRRPDYIAEAQAPARKRNEAFVEPMREMLGRIVPEGGDTSSIFVNAVTRAASSQREGMKLKRATFKFNREEAARDETESQSRARRKETGDVLEDEANPEDLPTQSDIENGTSGSSGTDDDDLGQSASKADNHGQSVPIRLDAEEEQAKAMHECHDAPLAGHFGVARTLAKLRRKYIWKGMAEAVKQYVHDCLPCNKAVPRRHKPYGLLQPLPIPKGPWREVTMDFITELPPSRMNGMVYDAILVIVDRFTKMAHYIPARGDWDGVDLAQAWIREVVRLHGTPAIVLSDRGPIMNAKHWDTFNHYLNSRRVLTSSFHPQTDGQTERQNQTLEQYLRCYCSLEQDDWALWISLAEFAYNDSVHSTTKQTPFIACYGFTPQGADWPEKALGDGESPRGFKMAERLIEIRSTCARKIQAANEYQKQLQDKKRSPLELQVGDEVLISSRHIKSYRPKKKLDWKYIGPAKVVEKIGSTAYKVDLPGYPGIHPVFHASLLEPYRPKGSLPHPEGPIQDTLQQVGDEVYEINKIIDREKDEDGNYRYLVSWKGYPPEENSWEPSINISGNALKAYFKKHNIAPRRQKGPKGAK